MIKNQVGHFGNIWTICLHISVCENVLMESQKNKESLLLIPIALLELMAISTCEKIKKNTLIRNLKGSLKKEK